MNTIPTISAIAAVACVYLFATAPAPLPEAPERSGSRNAVIPVSELFDTVNLVNAKTRQIWTSRIVGKGMEAGLKFEEHWLDDGEEAGPLPALFVRMVVLPGAFAAGASRTGGTAEQVLDAGDPPQVAVWVGEDAPLSVAVLVSVKRKPPMLTVPVPLSWITKLSTDSAESAYT